MLLSEMVESLLNKLGAGTLNESTIKGQLSLIYDQAKAQEVEIEAKKAEIQHAQKRITELEVKLHKQTTQGDRLEDGAEKILKLLFDRNDEVSEKDMAMTLQMQEGIVKYHCDVLFQAEMIYFNPGDSWFLIGKGRAYVVRVLGEK